MKPVDNADNAKSYSNSEKVRICRLFLLAPVACLVVVLLLMLVCMEMVPGMQKEAPIGSETDCVVVSSRNCIVTRSNSTNESTDHTLCSNSRSKSVQSEARCFKIVDWYTTEEAKERNRSVLSPDKHLRKTCSICLHNVSTQLLLEFKPNNKSYDGGRVTNNTSVVKNITSNSRCVVMPEDREFNLTPNGTCWTSKKSGEVDRKMEKTKVVVSLVFVVLLFLGLICFLFMCVFTEKVMRVCCHLCYDDKV